MIPANCEGKNRKGHEGQRDEFVIVLMAATEACFTGIIGHLRKAVKGYNTKGSRNYTLSLKRQPEGEQSEQMLP